MSAEPMKDQEQAAMIRALRAVHACVKLPHVKHVTQGLEPDNGLTHTVTVGIVPEIQGGVAIIAADIHRLNAHVNLCDCVFMGVDPNSAIDEVTPMRRDEALPALGSAGSIPSIVRLISAAVDHVRARYTAAGPV